MLVVLEDGSGGLTACDASPWDRLMARMRAGHLDSDLAHGASPDATVGLALRAQVLVAPRTRRNVACAVQRMLDTADGRRMWVPVCRDRVRKHSAEMRELIGRLLAPGPVSAQGVAKARDLFTDGSGPVYYRASKVDLGESLRTAVAALRP
jgi:hypothetical protein